MRERKEPKPQGSPHWPEIVAKIRSGDNDGMEELYRIFSGGVRFLLCRLLGVQDVDDKVHDVFLIVAEAIRTGDLREPERLMGYVRTVVRRQAACHIENAVHFRSKYSELNPGLALSDQRPDPERSAIDRENIELTMRMLNGVSKLQREVLIRFYLREQRASEICREMEITETQFRLMKSRAKARLKELAKSRFSQRNAV